MMEPISMSAYLEMEIIISLQVYPIIISSTGF